MPAIVSITGWGGRIFAVFVILRKDWTPEQKAQVLRALGTVIGTRRGDAGK
ncbi:hypothetical protein [Catenulispora acidiphila]|uniref:hypothetical protein n=1 Tax=Catenulispora acidiphila TaxID=304895 RepID=UPI00167FE1CB|nr:hypothetical protein [Catenulispora acidiphila]